MRPATPLAIAAVVLLAGCGGQRQAKAPDASQRARDWVPPSQARAADGGELYVSMGCLGCHSTDGRSGAGRTFLGLAGPRHSQASIARAIRRHRPALHPRPGDPQVRALAEFITMIGPTGSGATP